MREGPCVALLVLGLAAAAAAQSQPPDLPRVRLDYAAPPGCPDEGALRAAVAIRLGQDPFAPDASRLVRVRVAPTPGGFRVDVQAADEGGAPAGSREVESITGVCAELLDAAALAISIAIDPLAVARPAPPPPAEVVTRVVRVREVVRAASPRARGPVPRIAIGALGAFGAAPDPTVGARLALELGWSSVALGIEGRLDAATTAEGDGDARAELALQLASVAACLRHPLGVRVRVRGCALLIAGALRGEGLGVDRPRRATVPYVAAGARAAGELLLVGSLGLELHVDAHTPLLRAGFVLDGGTVWTTPRLALGAGIAATLGIP